MHWARHLVEMLRAVEVIARPNGGTVDELAEHLKVSRRTAYRVLETLQDLDFPLLEDTSSPDGRKRWQLEPSYLRKLPNRSVPELRLTLDELIALSFLRGGARLFKGTDVERKIDSAYAKLDAFVPEKLARQLEKVRTLFIPSGRFAKDYRGKQGIIDSLAEAMLGQRTCLVKYHSFGDDQVKNFRIDPLHFFERDGGLYLFVRATTFGSILILAVERIQEITVTGEAFKVPRSFDPAKLLESSFNLTPDDPVRVKVRFSADQARYVRERRWAAKQSLSEQPDGSVVLEMETSGRWDVKRWVLGFGAEAEVLEPKDLRVEIAAEVKAMGKAYARRPGSG